MKLFATHTDGSAGGRFLALLAVASIAFSSAALIGPALVSADANGNNGTLKVHEFGTPSGTESNDPKVCNFNFEGFGFDVGQTGYIVIEGQGQTSGTFDLIEFGPTNTDGYHETAYQTLPDGHYKATLYGKDTGQTGPDLTDEKAKSKVFKVDCEEDPSATPTPTAQEEEDDAALNIHKEDEDGNRLEGAVFTIEGMDGTFTTNANGVICITGLENDSEFLVTEIQAPEGYEIADEASQLVEVDNDGDCDSPDAVFVNTLAEEEEEEPSEKPSVSSPSPTPREDTLGGNPTPTPRGGTLPDTAVSEGSSAPIPAGLAALVALASLSVLVGVRFAEVRSRR